MAPKQEELLYRRYKGKEQGYHYIRQESYGPFHGSPTAIRLIRAVVVGVSMGLLGGFSVPVLMWIRELVR
jgi:hypothetical protein